MTRRLNKERLLFRRLGSVGKPIVSLDSEQLDALTRFRNGLRDGRYNLSPNPCLCGTAQGTVIASRDRYGLEVQTILCKACGLMRTDPYLDESSIEGFYANEYRALYTGTASTIDEFYQNQRRHGFEIAKFISLENPMVGMVFEVGCGAGGILSAFKSNGWRTAGCDFGEEYLTYGRQQDLSLVSGDASILASFGKADLLILCHVLEHFRDPVAELKKIRSLLSETGLLYVEVPGLFWIQNSYKNADIGRYLQNAHVYHFCLESLDYVLGLAGFERVKGDERVRSIYAPSNIEPVLRMDLYVRTITFLKWLEWERRRETLKSVLPLRTRIWLSRLKNLLVSEPAENHGP